MYHCSTRLRSSLISNSLKSSPIPTGSPVHVWIELLSGSSRLRAVVRINLFPTLRTVPALPIFSHGLSFLAILCVLLRWWSCGIDKRDVFAREEIMPLRRSLRSRLRRCCERFRVDETGADSSVQLFVLTDEQQEGLDEEDIDIIIMSYSMSIRDIAKNKNIGRSSAERKLKKIRETILGDDVCRYKNKSLKHLKC